MGDWEWGHQSVILAVDEEHRKSLLDLGSQMLYDMRVISQDLTLAHKGPQHCLPTRKPVLAEPLPAQVSNSIQNLQMQSSVVMS